MSRLMLAGSAIKEWTRRVMLGFAIVSAVALMTIMITTVIDVSRRYLLNQPWQVIVEFNQTVLILVIFCAVGMAQVLRGHIRVELVILRLSPKLQELLWLIALLAGFVLLLVIGIETLQDALRAYAIKEFMYGGGLQRFPIWWAKFAIPLGCWAMCAQLLVDMVRSVTALFGVVPLQYTARRESVL